MPETNSTPELQSAPISDVEIAVAMSTYGGSFASGLGDLWRFADDDNRARLKAAFPEYWLHYRNLVEMKRQPADPRRA